LKFVLLAFGAGIIVPLAIQLFLTLRSLHRNVEATSRRLNETMDALELAAKRAQQSSSPATRSLTTLAAALIPAIASAVRAYRGEDVASEETMDEGDGEDDGERRDAAPADNGSAKGAAAASPSHEVRHARA
jgi:hypothetical protein